MRTSLAAKLPAAIYRWPALGTLTMASGVFITMNAVNMLLITIGNITDFAANQAFVRHVLLMDTTNFGASPGSKLDRAVVWRAISAATLQNTIYVGIIAWELLSGVVLAYAAFRWATERDAERPRARSLSTAGLLMIVILFFGGFIVVGGEWFQMWRSTAWNGLNEAMRNILLAAVPLVLIHLPEAAVGDRRYMAGRSVAPSGATPGT